MEVNTAWQGNVLVASLKGEISMKNHASLSARLEELAKTGAKGLILNFSEVVYIASVGIGLLLKLVKEGKERGVAVRLAEAAARDQDGSGNGAGGFDRAHGHQRG